MSTGDVFILCSFLIPLTAFITVVASASASVEYWAYRTKKRQLEHEERMEVLKRQAEQMNIFATAPEMWHQTTRTEPSTTTRAVPVATTETKP